MKLAVFLLLFLIFDSIVVFSNTPPEGSMTLHDEIRTHIQKTMFKPSILTQLPEHDPAVSDTFLQKVKRAVCEKYPEITPDHIVHVIWPKEGWRTMREEFTGINRGRYCFAHIVIDSDEKDKYWVIQMNFMQKSKFFGLKHLPIYVRSILGVDLIHKKKREHTH